MPSIELPRGGGALRGIGEKLVANPVTGTASIQVPLAVTPGRAGLPLEIALAYDSGTGNGPFGLGWNLAPPAITRKTDKGLPRYHDEDVFVLAGAEDLVPCDAFDRGDHRVVRYRPRVEGSFTRIERWTHRTTSETYWQTTSRDNVTSTFGERIVDPDDPSRVFSWLLSETRDDRGNLVRYEYRAEDGEGVDRARSSEVHRFVDGRFIATAQHYLKRVRYGNRTPGIAAEWMFELVFDYGEHGASPTPDDAGPWEVRSDAFSTYRAGFEIRTYRRCKRALMFHRFSELGPTPCLVRSTDFTYETNEHVSYLRAVTHAGYVRDAAGTYERATLPSVELDYTRSAVHDEIVWLRRDSLEGVPGGVAGSTQWIDLDGEGIPGVLDASGPAWTYKRNLGGGQLASPVALRRMTVPAELGNGGQQLVDLDGDGRLELARYDGPLAGYFTRAGDDWLAWRPLHDVPRIDWSDPNVRFIDLDGDGRADVLISEDDVFVWYRAREAGFEPATVAVKPSEVLFADGTETIHLADVSGDGLVDLVRVRNGEVCYWPNLGHGRFGRKIMIEHAPLFDADDCFDPRRVRFADLDGSGPSDLFYLGRDGVDIYCNHAGNRLSRARRIALPPGDTFATVSVVDLLGAGTSCLVWSSPLTVVGPIAYVDLMGSTKPNLLATIDSGLGGETRISYAPSTRFYLADIAAGRPWVTRLPFPVHVVERIEHRDRIADSNLVTRYAYHHGFFDGVEREFRGFAFVEQWDAETFTGLDLDRPPAHTKTWFHTGAWLERERLELALAREYYDRDPLAPAMPATILPAGLTTSEEREATRALRGKLLRQEIFADDDTPAREHPYVVTEVAYEVRCEQRATDGHGVFFAHPRHTAKLHYERDPADPRIAFDVALEVDAFGTTIANASIVAPRRIATEPEQARAWVTLSQRTVANRSELDWYRAGVPIEETTFELTGLAITGVPTIATIRAAFAVAPDIEFEAAVSADTPGRRVIARSRLLYADTAGAALPLGSIESHALLYESYVLAMTATYVDAVYGARVDDPELLAAGYRAWDGAWWVPSGRVIRDPTRFFVPVRAIDPFGGAKRFTYDAYALFTTEIEDAIGNRITVDEIDYCALAATQVSDANRNRSGVRIDALGLVVATIAMGKGEGDTSDSPTTVIDYDLHAWRTRGEPASSYVRARETHRDPGTRWQESYHYSDGSGREVMTKVQAEPRPGTTERRWVGTGRTVFDNKGNAVKKYEPYFSDTYAYETEPALVASGVSPILRYDPIGRLVRTDFPDGTHARVTFDPWQRESWDACDTIAGTPWLAGKQAGAPHDQRAAALALAHAATPAVAHLDGLGRAFLAIADNGPRGSYATRTAFDMGGAVRTITDARGVVIATHDNDVLGRPLRVISGDAGETRVLIDVANKPRRRWDADAANDWRYARYEYDRLQRPTHVYEAIGAEPWKLVERASYGERHPDAEARNLRGRMHQSYDGAGVATSQRYDFAGNLIESTRRLAAAYNAAPDWSALASDLAPGAIEAAAEPVLEPIADAFTSTTSFDALRRVISHVAPDGSETRPVYNDAGLLEAVSVRVANAAWTTVVSNIDYNPRGQRTAIVLGAGGAAATTHYTYDARTFRLARVVTTTPGHGTRQDLAYTFDPTGNIVAIVDAVSHGNPAIDATALFVYDALYQLVSAEGREHPGQQPGHGVHELHPNDLQGLQRYRETYAYDEAGNFVSLDHRYLDGSGNGWVRDYAYVAGTNRLDATSVPGDAPGVRSARYVHDAAGNMTAMPHLPEMRWDARDRLASARVDADPSSGVFFAYDASGNRVRKAYRHGGFVEERIYLDGYEIYRKRALGSPDPVESRRTLHVGDGGRLVALVETSAANVARWRFQLENHLGSSVMELDEAGTVIGYEEYFAYGGTAWSLRAAGYEPRRYRYTGKERDEETGLYYHGSRYYAAWLGRWTSADPAPENIGNCAYRYCFNAPHRFTDPDGGQEEELDMKYLEQTIDHIQARAKGGHPLDPKNLQFMDRWTNSSKNARPEGSRRRFAVQSLAAAKSKGSDAFGNASRNMMSRSFHETAEVRSLWNKASNNGTVSYATAQGKFWDLVAEGADPDAKLVKESLHLNGVSQVPGSRRWALDPGKVGARTRWTNADAKEELKRRGLGIGKVLVVLAIVSAVGEGQALANAPDQAKQQFQDLDDLEGALAAQMVPFYADVEGSWSFIVAHNKGVGGGFLHIDGTNYYWNRERNKLGEVRMLECGAYDFIELDTGAAAWDPLHDGALGDVYVNRELNLWFYQPCGDVDGKRVCAPALYVLDGY